MIRKAQKQDLKEVAAIYSHFVEHSNATFDHAPLNEEKLQHKLEDLQQNFPFLCAFNTEGKLIGYGYVHPASMMKGYQKNVELSIYFLETDHEGMVFPLACRLIEMCRNKYHQIISVITSDNLPSVRLHEKLGFTCRGTLPRAGYKFGKYHDVDLYDLLLEDWDNPSREKF